MDALCVLYDETCGFCCACAEWLQAQPQLVSLACLPRQSVEAQRAFGDLRSPSGKTELVVVDDQGGVYRDADAWLVTLWALRDFRGWSERLVNPALKPMARSLFEFVSTNRHAVSKLLALQPDAVVRQQLGSLGDPSAPKCDDAGCAVPPPSSAVRNAARTEPAPPRWSVFNVFMLLLTVLLALSPVWLMMALLSMR